MEWLAKLLVSSALAPVLNTVLGWQKQRLEAAGSHEARVAELAGKELELDRREAEVQAEVVKTEQGNWMTRWVRPMFALPFVIFTFKIVVWDKVLGSLTQGHTDPLDERMWGVFMAVVVAYMGGRSAEKIADKIAGVWKK